MGASVAGCWTAFARGSRRSLKPDDPIDETVCAEQSAAHHESDLEKLNASVIFLQNRPHRAGAQTCLARVLRHHALRDK